jgi:serine/threonine protein kinase
MHNLSGCFVSQSPEFSHKDKNYYSFSIIFTLKERKFYVTDKYLQATWINQIKKAIGYENFLEFYQLYNVLGEGKFGVVREGVHKKTGCTVAIKMVKKEKMNNSDLEMMRSELDIMKLCQHPNIVRLLDHFENDEYIFLVMELLSGKNLNKYLVKNRFKFTEEKASNIVHQIASGLKYLHQYGVVHRDLKPDNIMLSDTSSNPIFKIMDFGFSKVLGPNERVADGFGTLSFVAPEVLVRRPYNKQIDIWSLGVILYYILSGDLPFDDEDDNEEKIAKKTVFEEVTFPKEKWNNRSLLCIDLISKCLVKNPEKRITIDNFIDHEWIQTYINQ